MSKSSAPRASESSASASSSKTGDSDPTGTGTSSSASDGDGADPASLSDAERSEIAADARAVATAGGKTVREYTYCVAENEAQSPLAPYHVEHGYKPEDSTVFVMAAEAPHSVTNHGATDRIHLVFDCVVNDWLRDMLHAAAQTKQPSSTCVASIG